MKKYLLAFVILLYAFQVIYAQRLIEGTVSDSKGIKIFGANIVVQGTTIGAISDVEGKFNLLVPSESKILIISYTGFESKEMELGVSNQINVVLNEGVLLEEAVVTALGIKRDEKSLGYSVAKVNAEEISNTPSFNIVNQLSGRAAGVMVQGSSGGNLGGSSRITLRGIRSMNGDNQALFVVDGIPMDNSNFTNATQVLGNGQGTVYESQRDYGNSIQDLNPDDIESISILKGQAASALYGSRGSNGVIQIVTKKGTKHRKGLGITINSSVTFDHVAYFPKFQREYGGGVDLLPRGYSDNSGYYKLPYAELDVNGDTIGHFKSFDLVPIYAVDESSGVKFEASTDQQFKHLSEINFGDNTPNKYIFTDGFGTNQSRLYFRDWNSWDSWDTAHFGKSRLWEVGDDPVKFFDTGVTISNSISIDGGNDKSTYRLSYTRHDQKGIYPNSSIKRNTFSLNGALQLNDKLSSSVNLNYINNAGLGRTAVTYDFRGGFNPAQNFSQWWHTDLRFDDLRSYENPDGSMRTWNRQSADNPRPQYWDNPYWSRYKNFETDGRDRIYGNIEFSYKINDWLSATGRLLTDFYFETREERIAFGSLLLPQYTLSRYHVSETNTDLIIKAQKSLSADLSLYAFAGTNKLWHKIESDFGATIGGMNIPGIYRLQNSKERPLITNLLFNKQIESFFGGASFGWKNMLFLDVTGRQDWSSALPENSNGYFYPSASASFVFTEAYHIHYLSFGKLRLGWAEVGGDTDPYNIYRTYTGNPNFGNNPNFTVSNTLNKIDLKPEQTSSIEIGTDLRFFHDRLGVDVTYYSGTTKDQIIPLATSTTSGYDHQFINGGEISNEGIEIDLHAVPIHTEHFSWKCSLNYSFNHNKVVSVVPGDPSITNLPLAFPGGVTFNAFVGEPYGAILGTNYIYDKAGNKLVDSSGNYIASGIMPIGNITPDFTGGFTNTFKYKNFSLNVFIDFRHGGDIFSITNLFGRYSGLLEESTANGIRENGIINNGVLAAYDENGNLILDGGGNTTTLTDDTYKTNNINNTTPVSYEDNKYYGGGFYINKRDIYDGSFIKLREISLTYNLPKKLLTHLGMSDASFSIVSRNVAILYKNLPNLDPEIAISTRNIQGNEGGAVPSTRSIGFNFKCTF
jgi:TonB-dependent SusC/RagA subfamily outer membrane receptor